MLNGCNSRTTRNVEGIVQKGYCGLYNQAIPLGRSRTGLSLLMAVRIYTYIHCGNGTCRFFAKAFLVESRMQKDVKFLRPVSVVKSHGNEHLVKLLIRKLWKELIENILLFKINSACVSHPNFSLLSLSSPMLNLSLPPRCYWSVKMKFLVAQYSEFTPHVPVPFLRPYIFLSASSHALN
jgi:hypothetical protein